MSGVCFMDACEKQEILRKETRVVKWEAILADTAIGKYCREKRVGRGHKKSLSLLVSLQCFPLTWGTAK